MFAIRSLTPSIAVVALVIGVSAGGNPAISSVNPSARSTATASNKEAAFEALAALEEEYNARVGLYAIDAESGASVSYRADERFAYTSTFKVPLAGMVLKHIPDRDRIITYGPQDLEGYSPVTEQHMSTGMTINDLAEATVRTSDNTAANLLLDTLGGPAGFAQMLAEIGDTTTNPVRYEPDLNSATPGDVRDTTTPRAWARAMRILLTGSALPQQEKAILIDWMTGNATGDELIRAGSPTGWTVADKSGAGDYGTRNDVGIAWSDSDSPVVMVVFTTHADAEAVYDNTLVSRAASIIFSDLTPLPNHHPTAVG